MDASQDRKVTKKFKIKANQQVRVATLNVRGLNQLTKRETLVKIMKDNQYEVLLLTETNVNLNSLEYWYGYTAFFSTNIEPKIREQEQNRRESTSIADKRPNNGTSHRLDADFEHAGVGIAVKNCVLNSLKDVKQINGRIATVTFASHGYDLTFICAYAPHSGYPTDTKEEFYDQLSKEIALCRGHFYVGGDFNARIHHIRAGDADVCVPYVIGRGMEYLNHMNEKQKKAERFSSGGAKCTA